MSGARAGTGLNRDRFSALFLLGLVIGISLLFVAMIRPFITALLLAAMSAAVLHPAYRRVTAWMGGRRNLAAGVVLLLAVVVILVPAAGFLAIVAAQAFQVAQGAGPAADAVQQAISEPGWLDRRIAALPFAEDLPEVRVWAAEKVGQAASAVGGWVVAGLAGVTRGAINLLLLSFVMLYALFFFLRDGSSLTRRLLYYMPLDEEDERRLLDHFASVTRAMLKGTLLIGVVQGGLAGLGFWVAGIPSAVFWGAVMLVLSMVPGIGTALVWVPACIYLAVTGQTTPAVLLALWCGAVVGTVDNLLRPFLVGRDTKMSDLMVMLGTLGGLLLFGTAGLLIGPIIAALFSTVWELYGEVFSDLLPKARTNTPPAAHAPPARPDTEAARETAAGPVGESPGEPPHETETN